MIFDVGDTEMGVDEILQRLRERSVLMVPFGPTLIRAVTHLDVSREAAML